MDLEISAPELNALVGRLGQMPAVVESELSGGMERIVRQGQAWAMATSPVWTGTLRRSWTAEATATTGRIGTNVPYARPVNDGRRAGAPMPPTGALLRWMASKGIPPEAEYVVRRAIGRRGIPPKRMKEQTIERLRPAAVAEMRAVVGRIAARLRG